MKIFDTDVNTTEDSTPEDSSIFESAADHELDHDDTEQDPSHQGEESEEETTEEEIETTPETEEEESDDNTDDARTVPYERFADVNRQKKELQETLKKFQESKEDPSTVTAKDIDEMDLPEAYRNLMGDDKDAKEFYSFLTGLTDQAKEAAIEQFKNSQAQESVREEQEMNQMVESMEESLDELELAHGTLLTGDSKEATANREDFLKYVETLSYGDSIYPLEHAFPLWEKQRSSKPAKNRANKDVARRISGKTTGANDTDSEPRELDWHDVGIRN